MNIVKKIRQDFPDVPMIANGDPTEETVNRTIDTGANAIIYTPPTTRELFKSMMTRYRDL